MYLTQIHNQYYNQDTINLQIWHLSNNKIEADPISQWKILRESLLLIQIKYSDATVMHKSNNFIHLFFNSYGKTHIHFDLILIGRRCHSSILDVRSFRPLSSGDYKS
jgi:hypothetical protein